jgi:hypothetical protein
MTPDIKSKLAVVLSHRMATEPRDLYVLVKTRKILERAEIEK